ncbi:MAG: hypothetical protein U0939_07125 [Pirellulales bacterium]
MSAHPETTQSTVAVRPLSPVLSARYALSWTQGLVVAGFSLWLLYLSHMPLFHAVTWRHAATGEWILRHGAPPTVDPTLALADGKAWTTTTWLSDVLFAGLDRIGGPAALAAAQTLVVFAWTLLLARHFYRECGRKRWMLLGVAASLAFSWTGLGILRPELIGMVAFAGLLLMRPWDAHRDRSNFDFIILPLLLATWANLDGVTALLGAIVLLTSAVGHAMDRAALRRSVVKAVGEVRVRRTVWLAEIAVASTLWTPLGLKLWLQAADYPSSPLWMSLGGAEPLVLGSPVGWSLLALAALAAVVLRLRHEPLLAAQWLPLIALGLLMTLNARLIAFFGPLALTMLLPPIARLFERQNWIAARPAVLNRDDPPESAFRFAWSLLSLLILWCAFALSPLATPLLGGKPRPLNRIVNRETPLAVSQILRDKPPRGLVWTPEHWGDWLGWDGPEGMRVSANSNAHLLPQLVRFDIGLVGRAEGTWSKTLDRYGVELLVVDKLRQPRLADQALREGDHWVVRYEDPRALVLKRKEAHE